MVSYAQLKLVKTEGFKSLLLAPSSGNNQGRSTSMQGLLKSVRSRILNALDLVLLFLRSKNNNKHASAKRLIVTLRVTMVTLRVTIKGEALACKGEALDLVRSTSMVSQRETIKGFALACKENGLLVSYAFRFPYKGQLQGFEEAVVLARTT